MVINNSGSLLLPIPLPRFNIEQETAFFEKDKCDVSTTTIGHHSLKVTVFIYFSKKKHGTALFQGVYIYILHVRRKYFFQKVLHQAMLDFRPVFLTHTLRFSVESSSVLMHFLKERSAVRPTPTT